LIKKFTLESFIRRRTLSKTLGTLAILSVTLISIAILLVRHQLSELHQNNINKFTANFNHSIETISQQVKNLARNDLIINSIIDYSNRNSYLPIFFRSLALSGSHNNTIIFSDFSGEPIASKNESLYQANQENFAWKNSVLIQGEDFIHYSKQGVLIASPVIYGNSAEGAIIAYIEHLSDFFSYRSNVELTILTDEDNTVLYSSNNELIKENQKFVLNKFSVWSTAEEKFNSLKIYSLQSPSLAYQQMLWLIIFILVTLISVFFSSTSSIRTASKLASNALLNLQKAINQSIKSEETIEVAKSINEPVEFEQIRGDYNHLLHNLSQTTISLDKFEGVINSLGEMLLVVDSNYKTLLSNTTFTEFCIKQGFSVNDNFFKVIPNKYLNIDENNNNFEVTYQQHSTDALNNKTISIKWTRSPYKNSEGQILGDVFVGRDITLARALEVDLLIKNKAIDEAQTSIFIIDPNQADMPITYANQAFSELTGYDIDEVIGLNIDLFNGIDTAPQAIKEVKNAINNKIPATITLVTYKKDGSYFHNELKINPFHFIYKKVLNT